MCILGLYTIYTFSGLPENIIWRLMLKKRFKEAFFLFKLKRRVAELDKKIFEAELKFMIADACDFSEQRYINIALCEALLIYLIESRIIVNQNIFILCNIPLSLSV